MIRQLLAFLVLFPAVVAAQIGAQPPRRPLTVPAVSPFPWFCSGAEWCDRAVAVVDSEPILLSEVIGEAQIQATRSNSRLPTDSAGLVNAFREVTMAIVDAKVILHAAQRAEVEIDETEVIAKMDAQLQTIRKQFENDSLMRAALRQSGFATVEAFRSQMMQQFRDELLQTGYMKKLRDDGKMPPVQV